MIMIIIIIIIIIIIYVPLKFQTETPNIAFCSFNFPPNPSINALL